MKKINSFNISESANQLSSYHSDAIAKLFPVLLHTNESLLTTAVIFKNILILGR